MINANYDVVGFWTFVILLLSSLSCYKSTLYIMPEFVPNEYMFTKHASKGAEKWEVYAWCVRDAIAKAGDFKVVDDLTI